MIIQVAGGLGNQMQQYAMWRKLLHLGRNAKLDLSWFRDPEVQKNVLAKRELELLWFPGLPVIECTPDEKKSLTGGSGLTGKIMRKLNCSKVFEETKMFHPEFLELRNGYLIGYFACEKYYADILGELRRLFRFPDCSGKWKIRRIALSAFISEEEIIWTQPTQGFLEESARRNIMPAQWNTHRNCQAAGITIMSFRMTRTMPGPCISDARRKGIQ